MANTTLIPPTHAFLTRNMALLAAAFFGTKYNFRHGLSCVESEIFSCIFEQHIFSFYFWLIFMQSISTFALYYCYLKIMRIRQKPLISNEFFAKASRLVELKFLSRSATAHSFARVLPPFSINFKISFSHIKILPILNLFKIIYRRVKLMRKLKHKMSICCCVESRRLFTYFPRIWTVETQNKLVFRWIVDV